MPPIFFSSVHRKPVNSRNRKCYNERIPRPKPASSKIEFSVVIEIRADYVPAINDKEGVPKVPSPFPNKTATDSTPESVAKSGFPSPLKSASNTLADPAYVVGGGKKRPGDAPASEKRHRA